MTELNPLKIQFPKESESRTSVEASRGLDFIANSVLLVAHDDQQFFARRFPIHLSNVFRIRMDIGTHDMTLLPNRRFQRMGTRQMNYPIVLVTISRHWKDWQDFQTKKSILGPLL